MGPEGSSEAPQQHPQQHKGLVELLKEMVTAKPKDEAPTAEQVAYQEHRKQADAEMSARDEARRADLEARQNSGETPVVLADERYEIGTGETPIVSPENRPEA